MAILRWNLVLPPVNIVFGFILAPILEENFQRALEISGGKYGIFFEPLPLLLFAFSGVVIGYNLLKSVSRFGGSSGS